MDDQPNDDILEPHDDELEDDEEVDEVVAKTPVDPEDDHESLDALADEEEEEDDDLLGDYDDKDEF